MKKLVSILLALAMILAMSTTVFAAEESFALTITGTLDHKYNVYQIYTGDVAKEDDTLFLANVKYGQNYTARGAVGAPVPKTELQEILDSEDPANYFVAHISGDPYAVINDESNESRVTINVVAGYYLIMDVTADLPDGQTKSPILLKVAEETDIASKHATIVSTKKVDDKNDSDDSEDAVVWQDSADYDIGDEVPFQLSVTIPSTYSTYEDYTLTFHDMLSAGFDIPENFKVYILKADNITEIDIPEASGGASGFTYHNGCSQTDTCEFEGHCSFNVTVGDLNDLYGTHTFVEGDKLIVEYTAQLNSHAHIGKDSNQLYNENGMYVCHPDGHTPKDYVRVLTYELTINKVDGANRQELTGAGFTLYKMDKNSKYNPVAVGKDTDGNPIYELAGSGMTTFTWTGIDGGQYKLVETTVPTGYNSLADIEFIVDATHATNWEKGTNAAFFNLIAKDASGNTVFTDAAGDPAVEDGKLESNIENFKGVVLPETGAEGTFFLITASTLLVMVAAVFMITRKKMSIYED